jgi:hypothetical protein
MRDVCKLRVALLSAGVLLAVLARDAAAARSDRDSCRTRGTTMTATPEARVYAVRVRSGDEFADRVYACLYETLDRRGVTRRLGIFNSGEAFATFHLAGRFVAYERLLCSRGDCAGDVRVTDIRRGTTRRSAHFGPGFTQASTLVVTPHGAAAWIRFSQTTYIGELRKLDADGEAVLDSAPGVELDSRSLAAGERTIYWQHNGETRSAPVR